MYLNLNRPSRRSCKNKFLGVCSLFRTLAHNINYSSSCRFTSGSLLGLKFKIKWCSVEIYWKRKQMLRINQYLEHILVLLMGAIQLFMAYRKHRFILEIMCAVLSFIH